MNFLYLETRSFLRTAALRRRTLRACQVFFLPGLLWLSGSAALNTAVAAPDADTSAAIEYLIDTVSQSDMQFVRNFSKHDARRAAKHIRDKYDHFHDDIDSVEKFIELCASESLLTGRNYKVILPGGEERLSRDWMLDLLAEYRTEAGGPDS